MSSFADANCEMRVNFRCPACKMEMMDVLGSVIGGYSVDIAGSEGLARVRGEVDPNMFLKALSRTGKHAEIARVSLKHPMMNQHYPRHRTGYGDDAHLYGPYHHNYYDTSSSSNRRYNDNYKYGYGVYPDQQQYPWNDNAGTSYHGGGHRQNHHQYRRQFNPMRGTTPCCASTGGGCGGYGPFNGYGLG